MNTQRSFSTRRYIAGLATSRPNHSSSKNHWNHSNSHRASGSPNIRWITSSPPTLWKNEEDKGNTTTQSSSSSSDAFIPPAPLISSYATAKAQRELKAVNIAVAINSIIAVGKIFAWLTTSSGAMLAEAIHSFADILNQLLLRAGVQLSRKPATRQHPYGFHKEKYIFSLMSAVGIFCLGAGASVLHGVQSIFDPPQLTNMAVSLKVIVASGLLEFYSLRVAFHAIRVGAAKEGQPFWAYIMRGRDPTTAAVFAEDAGAVAGLGIAGMSTYLTHLTGNPLYDSIGSISIGLLMGGIAITLIRNNKRFLIGQSMPPEMHEKVVSHLKADPMVVCVVDPKSEEMGDGVYRFKAEIQWSGDCVVKKYLAGMKRQTAYEEIEKLAQLASNSKSVEEKELAQEAMDGKMFEFGRGVITTVGGEIDRLEIELKGLIPGLVYCDLETDKGRAEEVVMSSLEVDLNKSEKKMSSSRSKGGGEGGEGEGLGDGDSDEQQQQQQRREEASS